MNVGRVNRIVSMYNAGNVSSIGPTGLTATGPRSQGSAPQGVAPPNAGTHATAGKDTAPANSQLAVSFTNADGDRAEISNKAMELWRRMSAGGDAPQQQNGPTTALNYKMNLPSPFLNWEQILANWETPTYTSGHKPDIAPPPGAPAPPRITPPDAGTPGVGTGAAESSPIEPKGECHTCSSRRYVDKSDDASVSFQTPTKVNPNMAMGAVVSHENEHVSNEKSKAQREDRKIVNQTVTLTYDTCPECGRNYVSGGTTRTTTVGKSDSGDNPNQPPPTAGPEPGGSASGNKP